MFTVNISVDEFYVNFWHLDFHTKIYNLQSFQHGDKAKFLRSQNFIKVVLTIKATVSSSAFSLVSSF